MADSRNSGLEDSEKWKYYQSTVQLLNNTIVKKDLVRQMVILESENAARIWFVILSGMIPSPKPRPVVVELLSDLSVVLAALSTTADY